MRKMTRLAQLALSLALPLGLAAGALAQEQPRAGGELRYGTFTEIAAIDPHVYTGTSGRVLDVVLNEGLLAFDAKGALVPSLATEWSSDDAKTYTFKIRRNV